jgi:hypothetical protein
MFIFDIVVVFMVFKKLEIVVFFLKIRFEKGL